MLALCGAIAARRVVVFAYKGAERRVEPHIVGVDASGMVLLEAWQLSGGSGADWRNFHVGEMGAVAVLDSEIAEARSGYNPASGRYARILCCV